MNAPELSMIAFDADDTLWENERYYRMTQAEFAGLLADYTDEETLDSRLLETERKNLKAYGFGTKGFTLSMIETALDVTNDRVPQSVIRRIIELAHDMLDHPIEPLPNVVSVLDALKGHYRMIVITKGDLLDQERKLAQSGLGDYFEAVEIVSDKNRYTYESIFAQYCGGAENAMMVGNSLKSDIIPALEAGAWATYIPHDMTWAMERASEPQSFERYNKIETLNEAVDIIKNIQGKAA